MLSPNPVPALGQRFRVRSTATIAFDLLPVLRGGPGRPGCDSIRFADTKSNGHAAFRVGQGPSATPTAVVASGPGASWAAAIIHPLVLAAASSTLGDLA